MLKAEMLAAARLLAEHYDEIAHVAGLPDGDGQACTVCGYMITRHGPPWFPAGGVVFQSVKRDTGRTAGHAAAGDRRPLTTREDFELWPGERWCDIKEVQSVN